MISRKAARDKGTAWNKAITDLLKAEGWPHAEPRTKNGRLDRGDVTGVAGVMIEAKNEKRPSLSRYMSEVSIQRYNADAAVGAAWIKRPGSTKAADGVVVMHLHTFAILGIPEVTLLGPLNLADALRQARLVPDEPGSALMLRRPSGVLSVAAVTGGCFVQLLKAGGYQ